MVDQKLPLVTKRCGFTGIKAQTIKKMLFCLMWNKFLSADAELEKDWLRGLEMRELNDTEKI